MPYVTTIYDDGSTLVQDAGTLTVVGGTDVSGAQLLPAGGSSNIGDRFMNLLDFGVRAALVNRYGTAATSPQTYQTPAQAAAQSQNVVAQLMPLLLIAAGAFIVYKLAT